MKGALRFSLYSVLVLPPVARGFVQQSFAGLRRNRNYRASRAVVFPAHPHTADSDGSRTIEDGENYLLPFHHSSTVYIEMTDM